MFRYLDKEDLSVIFTLQSFINIMQQWVANYVSLIVFKKETLHNHSV